MATVLAKLFIRSISQPFDHTQTGVSLWTLEDIEKRQRKEKEDQENFMLEMARLEGGANGAKNKNASANAHPETNPEASIMELTAEDEEALLAMEQEALMDVDMT